MGSHGQHRECAHLWLGIAGTCHLRSGGLFLGIRKIPAIHLDFILTQIQRPFVNSYAPTFILYELSSPFLNFHWFFDKLNMTGSRWQLINGIVLLATFFFCRLLWGTYQSIRVYQDVWAGLYSPPPEVLEDALSGNSTVAPITEVMRFAGKQEVPMWLAMTYLGSNIILNTLNFYWFGKMIETVRKRFQPPKEKKERSTAATKEDGDSPADIRTSVEVDGKADKTILNETEVRRRKV
jgi:hypothetical protein